MLKKRMITLAMCCFTTLLMGQNILSVKTHTQQRLDTLELQLMFDVAPGMHLYAPSSLNQSQGYMIMKLEIDSVPEGLQLLSDHHWPEPTLSGSGEVYTGNGHTIICRFTGNAKKLPAVIKGSIHYQACNEEMCFPPQEKAFEVALQKQSLKKKN